MRADALRNRRRILDAARQQITAHGADVPMEQIAATAGVAVGTLYRHYPTKADLVGAIYAEFSEALLQDAEAAGRSIAEPGDAMHRIVDLLVGFVRSAATSRAFVDAVAALDSARATPDQEDRARIALRVLLDAARSDGDLRPGITPDDIVLLMVAAPTNLPEPARDRWLTIVIAGIGT